MKVEYVENWDYRWFWRVTEFGVYSYKSYTRRQDAKRGFERFCARVMANVMKRFIAWLAAWRERRDTRKRYKEFDAGFEYALSALRERPNGRLPGSVARASR